jgi:hypothetical protein
LETQETLREINIQDHKDKGICEKKQKINGLRERLRRRLRSRDRYEGYV